MRMIRIYNDFLYEKLALGKINILIGRVRGAILGGRVLLALV